MEMQRNCTFRKSNDLWTPGAPPPPSPSEGPHSPATSSFPAAGSGTTETGLPFRRHQMAAQSPQTAGLRLARDMAAWVQASESGEKEGTHLWN